MEFYGGEVCLTTYCSILEHNSAGGIKGMMHFSNPRLYPGANSTPVDLLMSALINRLLAPMIINATSNMYIGINT